MEEIVLQYMYPRIDEEVTKKRNHLLKAPFCVHPATGLVVHFHCALGLVQPITVLREYMRSGRPPTGSLV